MGNWVDKYIDRYFISWLNQKQVFHKQITYTLHKKEKEKKNAHNRKQNINTN